MLRRVTGRRLSGLVRFTEDQQLLREAVRGFALSEIVPIVDRMDREAKLDKGLIEKLFAAGYMGIEGSPDYGGVGGTFADSLIVIEEIARVDPSVAVLVDIHNTLIVRAVSLFGSEEQKREYLPKLTAGQLVGSFCLSESNAGSDAFALSSKAVPRSDGLFEISGTKLWISNSKEAEFFLVFAKEPSGELGAYIVDKSKQTSDKQLIVGPSEKKLGIKASSTCAVTFDTALGSRLGKSVSGKKISMGLLNEGRIGIAAQMLGATKAAYFQAVPHLFLREQFGERLFDFQALRFEAAKVEMQIKQSELLIWDAVAVKESGNSTSELAAAAAMAKLFSTELAVEVAAKSIDWLGGMGFCSGGANAGQGSSLEKLYRDVKIGTIYEGTSNMQLETICKWIERKQ